jgi:PPP family 3-phenylpropionic acid transporter
MTEQARRFSRFLFVYYAHAGTFATYASLFFAARGMDAAQVAVLMALIQLMRIVGPNVWSWVADRLGRHALVLRATAAAALLAFTGFFFAHGFAALFACMLLLNFFTSAQSPLCEALALAEMRGDISNYGRIRLWGSLGFIVAVTATGYALQRWGVDALLWAAGGLLAPVLAAAARIRDVPMAAPAHAPAPPVLHVLRKPQVAAFFASAALMVAAHTSFYTYYSLYLARIGYAKPVIGAMWSLGVAAEIVFFWFQAPLFRRFGAQRLMQIAFAVALLRFTVIGAAAQSLALLVAAQVLHAFTFGMHHSSSITTMQRWFAGPLQARGQALYLSIAYGIGGTLGGLFLSQWWDRAGPASAYYAAAGLAGCGWLCARMAFARRDA